MKIELRLGTDDDRAAILELYRLAMGGDPGMRGEAYWCWKHLQNPFGRSPIILAFDGEKLVGLRVFLRWELIREEKPIYAYRAVDTATHPDYRGRGVFTSLTMELIKQVAQGPPAVVFNTPNSQSGPGYLKMGWKLIGRTRLLVGIKPFNRLLPHKGVQNAERPEFSGTGELLGRWMKENRNSITTLYSEAFLNWRYRDSPVADYKSVFKRNGDSSILLIYRVKTTKGMKELRLCEVFLVGLEAGKILRETLCEINVQERPDVITALDNPEGSIGDLLGRMFFRADRLGLQITLRELNDRSLYMSLSSPMDWNFSSGSLELL